MAKQPTMRVRPPLSLREELEQIADSRGIGYRRLLQHLVRQALRINYTPTKDSDEKFLESRIPVDAEERDAVRKLAKQCRMRREEWLLAVLANHDKILHHGEEQAEHIAVDTMSE
jgi:hypothetical protein